MFIITDIYRIFDVPVFFMKMYSEAEYNLGMKRLILVSRRTMIKGISLTDCDALPWNVCVMCGHSWKAIAGTVPDKCPACKSTRWNENELIMHICVKCKHEWASRSDVPVRCPSCRSKLWNRCTRDMADSELSCSPPPIVTTGEDQREINQSFIHRTIMSLRRLLALLHVVLC